MQKGNLVYSLSLIQAVSTNSTCHKRKLDCPLQVGCSKGQHPLADRHRKSTFLHRSHTVGCVSVADCYGHTLVSEDESKPSLSSYWVQTESVFSCPHISLWCSRSRSEKTWVSINLWAAPWSKSLWLQQDNYIIQDTWLQQVAMVRAAVSVSSSNSFNFDVIFFYFLENNDTVQ